MNSEEYGKFVEILDKLNQAVALIFREEVKSKPDLENAFITDISFSADCCEVEYNHCCLRDCDESYTLRVDPRKMLQRI